MTGRTCFVRELLGCTVGETWSSIAESCDETSKMSVDCEPLGCAIGATLTPITEFYDWVPFDVVALGLNVGSP